jgi:O-antigen/teichoic acid export membrane protein
MTNRDGSSVSRDGLITNGVAILIATATNLALAFFIKIAIARSLTTVGYGRVVIGVSVMTLTKTLVTLGIDKGIARYLPRKPGTDWHRSVVFSAFQLVIPVALAVTGSILLVGGVIATQFFDDASVGPVIEIFAVAMVFDIVRALSIRVTQGMERSKPKIVIDILHPVVRLAAVGIALLLGYGPVGIALAFLFSNVAGAVMGLLYLRFRTDVLSAGPYERIHPELIRFSAPLLVASITLNLFSNVDLFMLGYFDSSGTVGIYSAMYSLATIISFFLVSFEYLYMPAASRLDASGDREELHEAYNTVTTWATVTTVPTFAILALAPALFIGLTFGPDYTDGSAALVVISAAYVVSAVLGPNMKTLLSMGYSRSIMAYNILGFTLDIVLNIVLIPRYSFLGASIATLAAYVVMNGCYAVQLYRVSGIIPRPRMRYILDVVR